MRDRLCWWEPSPAPCQQLVPISLGATLRPRCVPRLVCVSGDCGLLQEAALALSSEDYRAPPSRGSSWVISIRLGPQVLSDGFAAAASCVAGPPAPSQPGPAPRRAPQPA